MKAIVISKPGGPEVLELRDVPAPEPQRGEVAVAVRATAVNRADLLQRMGFYPAPPHAPKDIPGLEFAGVVDAVGEDVSDWRVGERVFGLVGGGSYAERVVVPSRTLVAIPQRLSFAEAAATPEAFITAWDAMVTQVGLATGETVLIHAVGSGVGTAAVQLARALGARALGTARSVDKIDRASKLGLAAGVVPEDGKFAVKVRDATSGRGVDVVVELVGGAYVTEDLACVAHKGRIVVVGLMAGARAEISLEALLSRRLTLVGTVLRSRPLEEKIAVARAFARHVVPLLADGVVAPVVDRTMPLARAAEAHEYVASNQGFGKVVLEI